MNLNEHINRMKNLFNAEHGIIKPLISEQKKLERFIKSETFSEYCTSTVTPMEVVNYVEDLEDMGFKCVGSADMLISTTSKPRKNGREILLMKPMPLDPGGGYLYLDLKEEEFVNPIDSFGYYVEYGNKSPREGRVDGVKGVIELEQELEDEFKNNE
jgi:hypothetical protein